MTNAQVNHTRTTSTAFRIIGIVLTCVLYTLMIPVALVSVIVWYSLMWPWYVWKKVHHIRHPR